MYDGRVRDPNGHQVTTRDNWESVIKWLRRYRLGVQRVLMGTAAHQEHGTRKISILGSGKNGLRKSVLYYTQYQSDMVGIYSMPRYLYVYWKPGWQPVLYLFGKNNTRGGTGIQRVAARHRCGEKGCFAHAFTFDKLNM